VEASAVRERSDSLVQAISQPPPSRRVDSPLARHRRHLRIMRELASELGIEQPSVAERGLLEAVATLTMRSEQLRASIVRGEPVDGDLLVRLAGEARRIMTILAQRAPEPHVQTLDEYLAQRAAERVAPDDGADEAGG
jgi:hypothetical protein